MRNEWATVAGDCLLSATAAFMAMIAFVVSSALTAFTVWANAGPSAASTLCLMISAAFW